MLKINSITPFKSVPHEQVKGKQHMMAFQGLSKVALIGSKPSTPD
jgi:hypothetical protein